MADFCKGFAKTEDQVVSSCNFLEVLHNVCDSGETIYVYDSPQWDAFQSFSTTKPNLTLTNICISPYPNYGSTTGTTRYHWDLDPAVLQLVLQLAGPCVHTPHRFPVSVAPRRAEPTLGFAQRGLARRGPTSLCCSGLHLGCLPWSLVCKLEMWRCLMKMMIFRAHVTATWQAKTCKRAGEHCQRKKRDSRLPMKFPNITIQC